MFEIENMTFYIIQLALVGLVEMSRHFCFGVHIYKYIHVCLIVL